MKVLFVSNLNPRFVNTNFYRRRAIKELGHRVVFFDDRKFILPGRIREKIAFLQDWDLRRLNRKLVRLASKERPNLCLAVGGFRMLDQTLEQIKERGSKTALWTTDAPRDYANIIQTAPLYDHVFCAGTEAVELLENHGIKGTVWLPFACDPEYHKPVDLTESEAQALARDVVFVGGFYPNRWEILRELEGFSVGIWGPYWNRVAKQAPRNCHITASHLNYAEWVKIYNAAKVVIVIHYQDNEIPCYQASPKVFEALACKAFVLSDRQKDVLSLFDDGEHLVFFDDVEDLKGKIAYYLRNDPERNRIAGNGYAEVLNKHTYFNRLKQLFDIVESGVAAKR